MREVTINDSWTLSLPDHRADRVEWPVWEKERLASMFDTMAEVRSTLKAKARRDDLAFRPPVILDVGVEEGDLTGLWAQWGWDVYMVEPNPKVWPNVRAIWEANGFDQPLGFWVGFAGEVDEAPRDLRAAEQWRVDAALMRNEYGQQWPVCSFGPLIGDHGFRHLAQETDTTPVRKIDTMGERINAGARRYIDAITMDIEGAELAALKGAETVLKTHRPHVWVSVHASALKDFYGLEDGPEQVVAYMESLGYASELLATDHEAHWKFSPR